ncbi:biogenesis of lysosome-related organelles complex 1 subunit 6 isoform X3 [Dendropsophus ebraccatus]|uniref:biogenesis of lysosome-related organelles complex 1 subunit 6 isoform X3 n=1 Tax=Dendropsophus ebraccatus TaxID=150705 RepID=UPI00383180D5
MEEEGQSDAPAVDGSTSSPGHNAAAGESIEVIDEGLPDDLPSLDSSAVEQLSEGLISHYLPNLQNSKLALQELTQNQVVLLDTLEQEISKFRECNSVLDINALKRALKLQQKKQEENLKQEQQRERELEREKQLTAKPAKRT